MVDTLDGSAASRDRYLLHALPDGDGVLVDLETGQYFKLNRGAVALWETALSYPANTALAAERLNISVTEAGRLLAEMKERLARPVVPQKPPGPITYTRLPDGSWALEDDGLPIFSIANEGYVLRFCAAGSDLKSPMALYLQAMVPKLLARLSVPVLHAAACQIGGKYVAFSGASGAGKTTTAHAFRRAGASLASEDLLVLSLDGELPAIFLRGEKFARDWAHEMVSTFQRHPESAVNYEGLAEAQKGDTVPLAAIWFLAADRRSSEEIRQRPLSISDGLLALLGNGLLATSHVAHWQDFFRRSVRIAERIPISEATMPAGLESLHASARRYIANSAS